jgi:hypothetical protein
MAGITGRRRISHFQWHALSFLPLKIQTDFQCRVETEDSSVAVVSGGVSQNIVLVIKQLIELIDPKSLVFQNLLIALITVLIKLQKD